MNSIFPIGVDIEVDIMINGGCKAMFSYKPWRLLRLMLILSVPIVTNGCGEDGSTELNSKQLYRKCVTCHSMAPGRHLIGPSLAGIWGRKAGMVEGFDRYSNAMTSSEVVWTTESMDAWLQNPQAFIPGNQMMFEGIQNRQIREELVAKLKKKAAP